MRSNFAFGVKIRFSNVTNELQIDEASVGLEATSENDKIRKYLFFWITELCPDAWEKVCGNVGKEMFLLWLQKISKCISCHAVYLRRTHYVHFVAKSMEWLHVVLPDCNYDGWTTINKVVKIRQRSWWSYLSHRSGGVLSAWFSGALPRDLLLEELLDDHLLEFKTLK